MTKYTKYERETIILFNEAEDTANVSTRSSSWIHRMDKLAQSRPDVVKVLQSSNDYAEYELPKSCIRIVMPSALSPEERERRSQNMKRIREKYSNNATA